MAAPAARVSAADNTIQTPFHSKGGLRKSEPPRWRLVD
jgi:hypothetical protein